MYIWTLLGLSWLGGLISLIVDSASKVALKSRPDQNDSIEYKMDCGRYVNNVRVVLGVPNGATKRNNNQPGCENGLFFRSSPNLTRTKASVLYC